MKTVGIMSCGELGAAFASILLARGMNVVTNYEDRSESTMRNGRRIGVRELGSFRKVVEKSDILLSLAHPEAAETVADRYLKSSQDRPCGAMFIDMNSVAPETIRRIAERFEKCAVPFVDAALVGPASRLTTTSTLYLSGQFARQAADYFEADVQTKVLGSRAGEASALKMLLGGMNKGIAALFIELGLTAQAMGSLTPFLKEYEASYPEVMRLVERMVPTYSRHAERRSQEVRQLDSMIRSLGLKPSIAAGTQAVVEDVARLRPTPCETAEDLIRQLAGLRRQAACRVEARSESEPLCRSPKSSTERRSALASDPRPTS